MNLKATTGPRGFTTTTTTTTSRIRRACRCIRQFYDSALATLPVLTPFARSFAHTMLRDATLLINQDTFKLNIDTQNWALTTLVYCVFTTLYILTTTSTPPTSSTDANDTTPPLLTAITDGDDAGATATITLREEPDQRSWRLQLVSAPLRPC
ncbi:hypothetical protein DXG03_002093 [Asterophora parasitica]|uniref:Uncharacterized protein n=1 Tax=Asterophora parasitica TaxID=117018 RepID=A0A9P7KB74_9AGAR|nr:hypothetical protein DXG03_002093 [Asterophora parasitica]